MARAGYLDLCAPLFTAPRIGRAPTGFARLAGQFRGWEFDIQALPDALTYRKLPSLWLLVTIPAPMPVAATLDIMRRPIGGETFSHFDRLDDQVVAPPGLPPDAVLRTDDAARLPPAELLADHFAVLSAERAKELVISPKGLRLTWLAEEADRARYLLFRDAELGMTPLGPAVLSPLLGHLSGLAEALAQAGAGAR